MSSALELAHEPTEHRRPVGAVGRRADVVLEDQQIRMLLPIAKTQLAKARIYPSPIRPESPVAGRPRRHGHRDAQSTPAGRCRPARGFGRTLHDPSPRDRAGRVVSLPGKPVNDCRQVLQDQFTQCLWIGIVLLHREAACANALLEFSQFRCFGSLTLKVGTVAAGGKVIQVGRIAEIEEGVLGHLGIVQNAVKNFQLGDRFLAVDMFLQPRLAIDDLRRDRFGTQP